MAAIHYNTHRVYIRHEVGNEESHPLSSLMETIGSLIEAYEAEISRSGRLGYLKSDICRLLRGPVFLGVSGWIRERIFSSMSATKGDRRC